MANWTSAMPTRDQALADDVNYGSWRTLIFLNDGAGTADLGIAANGAGISAHRSPSAITVPGVTAPVTGYCVTQCDIINVTNSGGTYVGLEFPLGTLTVSGNVFSGGASMPTRTVLGSSLQLGTLQAFVVITTTLVATTPTLTITYTNQSGVGGKTCTIALPTNAAVNSAFALNIKLASGDTGIQAVTNISISAGTGGALKIYGFLPFCYGGQASTVLAGGNVVEVLSTPLPMIKALPNDTIAVYYIAATANTCFINLIATPET